MNTADQFNEQFPEHKFIELIENFPGAVYVSIAFKDDVISIANEKMTNLPWKDKQALLGMVTTNTVDWLTSEIPME